MPPNTTLDQVKGQIIPYLENIKLGAVFQQEIAKIETHGTFVTIIPAPQAPEITLDIKDYPTKGNAKANINVIEISDYLCGHCQKAHPVVSNLFNKYKDKISLTQINFSLHPNGLSGTYARGAYCALEQNSDYFWKYHDETFKKTTVPHDHSAPGHEHDDNDGTSPQSLEKVVSVAKTAGLNIDKFNKCLSSKESFNNVEKTNQQLKAQGINSTPVFIVNNLKLASGVKELEEVIKESL